MAQKVIPFSGLTAPTNDSGLLTGAVTTMRETSVSALNARTSWLLRAGRPTLMPTITPPTDEGAVAPISRSDSIGFLNFFRKIDPSKCGNPETESGENATSSLSFSQGPSIKPSVVPPVPGNESPLRTIGINPFFVDRKVPTLSPVYVPMNATSPFRFTARSSNEMKTAPVAPGTASPAFAIISSGFLGRYRKTASVSMGCDTSGLLAVTAGATSTNEWATNAMIPLGLIAGPS